MAGDKHCSKSKDVLNIVSYNMHGFNQGKDILNVLCSDNKNQIIFVQEHWQAPCNLNKVLCFSSDFVGFGQSAFENKVSSGILYGRPYGGVATLIRSNFAKHVSNVICDERFVIVCIGDVALINVYLPCRSNAGVNVYINLVTDTIDQVYAHLTSLDCKSFIFGGDLNTDLRRSSPATDVVNGLARSFDLIECSRVCTPSTADYTFYSLGQGHRTWIDWFLLSSSLRNCILGLEILDIEPNLSDHLPIVLTITTPRSLLFVNNDNYPGQSNRDVSRLRWDKADLQQYYDLTRINLEGIFDDFRSAYFKLLNDRSKINANFICLSKHHSLCI